MPPLEQITPVIRTFNEERNLRRVLEQLTWAQRILLIDTFSTDDTLAIARAYPQVEIMQRHFDSFAEQCNYGIANVHTDWVLSLDADYVCSSALIEEVAALPADSVVNGYAAAFRYCVGGRPLRASLYPPRTVLYRREHATYWDDGHTQRVRISGTIGRLSRPIDHDDRKPLAAWLRAQERYVIQEAEKLRRTLPSDLNRADRLRRRIWIAPLVAPLYCLLAKGLLWEGPAGWYYALQRTYAELLLSITLAEQRFSHEP